MSAEKGWIGEPQPQRTSLPGEERKWRIMMGNGQFLTDEDRDRLERYATGRPGLGGTHER